MTYRQAFAALTAAAVTVPAMGGFEISQGSGATQYTDYVLNFGGGYGNTHEFVEHPDAFMPAGRFRVGTRSKRVAGRVQKDRPVLVRWIQPK